MISLRTTLACKVSHRGEDIGQQGEIVFVLFSRGQFERIEISERNADVFLTGRSTLTSRYKQQTTYCLTALVRAHGNIAVRLSETVAEHRYAQEAYP